MRKRMRHPGKSRHPSPASPAHRSRPSVRHRSAAPSACHLGQTTRGPRLQDRAHNRRRTGFRPIAPCFDGLRASRDLRHTNRSVKDRPATHAGTRSDGCRAERLETYGPHPSTKDSGPSRVSRGRLRQGIARDRRWSCRRGSHPCTPGPADADAGHLADRSRQTTSPVHSFDPS